MSATAAAENNSPVTNNAEQAGPNEPKTEADAGVKQCRICLAGAEEEATCGRLIKPCLCRGSMQVRVILLTTILVSNTLIF